MNLTLGLRKAASFNGDAVALVAGNVRLTHQEMLKRVSRVAAAFRNSAPCSLSRISGCRTRALYPLARPRAERHPLPAPIPFS